MVHPNTVGGIAEYGWTGSKYTASSAYGIRIQYSGGTGYLYVSDFNQGGDSNILFVPVTFNLDPTKVSLDGTTLTILASRDLKLKEDVIPEMPSEDMSEVVTPLPANVRRQTYSTEEQIVGTWIDGKPIYQKTFDMGNMTNAGTTTYAKLKVALNVANFDKMIFATGIIYYTGSGYAFQGVLPYPKDADGAIALIDTDETYIQIEYLGNWNGCNAYVTVQYTKTTD